MKATLPVFFPEDEERRSAGWTPPSGRPTGAWMEQNGLLKQPPYAARALTNEFLPGEGLDPGVSGLE